MSDSTNNPNQNQPTDDKLKLTSDAAEFVRRFKSDEARRDGLNTEVAYRRGYTQALDKMLDMVNAGAAYEELARLMHAMLAWRNDLRFGRLPHDPNDAWACIERQEADKSDTPMSMSNPIPQGPPAFNRGDIVSFGPEGARRVGIVIGAYEDPVHGETLCVRTPQNTIKQRRFDSYPIKLMNARQESASDLLEAMDAALDEAGVRTAEYFSAAIRPTSDEAQSGVTPT